MDRCAWLRFEHHSTYNLVKLLLANIMMQVVRTLTFYLKVIFQDYGTPICLNFTNTLRYITYISKFQLDLDHAWILYIYISIHVPVSLLYAVVYFSGDFLAVCCTFLHYVQLVTGIIYYKNCSAGVRHDKEFNKRLSLSAISQTKHIIYYHSEIVTLITLPYSIPFYV